MLNLNILIPISLKYGNLKDAVSLKAVRRIYKPQVLMSSPEMKYST